MPFLNPPDVLPEAMRFIIRLLLANKNPIEQDELIRLLAPLGLAEAIAGESFHPGAEKFTTAGIIIAEKSLDAMRASGLISRASGGSKEISAGENITSEFERFDNVSAKAFANFIRENVIKGASDVYSDDDTQGGAEDLAHAVALLFQVPDPLEPIVGFTGPPEAKSMAHFQSEKFGSEIEDWVVRNQERYVPLTRWAAYLGYSRVDDRVMIVDPSDALRNPVARILGQKEMTISSFLDELGSEMPMSDRGSIGLKVRKNLNENVSSQISPGISLGLSVLRTEGVIELRNLDDAESLEFLSFAGSSTRYSHIGVGEVK